MRLKSIILLSLMAGLSSACSQKVSSEIDAADAVGMAGLANAPGDFLAYEHQASVRLPVADMPERVAAVRDACLAGKHGKCTVLGEEMRSGEYPSASLVLRVVPAGVEPLLGLASQGGEVAQRSTRAEDLAVAVHDTSLRKTRLRIQHQRLLELMARDDASAQDLIAINRELADIEATLQQAEQEAAQQQLRISTNLLTLSFGANRLTASTSELGRSFDSVVSVLDHSAAVLVMIVVAMLPFAVLGVVIYLLVRTWRRRRRRAV
jgi:hypothetical protein